MKISTNIGTVDRAVRIFAGLGLLALVPMAVSAHLPAWGFIGLLGAVPALAGIIGFCPPYAWLRINTAQGRGPSGA